MGDIDVFGQRAMPQEEKVESEGRVRRRAVFPRSDEELMKESEGDGSDDDDEEEDKEMSEDDEDEMREVEEEDDGEMSEEEMREAEESGEEEEVDNDDKTLIVSDDDSENEKDDQSEDAMENGSSDGSLDDKEGSEKSSDEDNEESNDEDNEESNDEDNENNEESNDDSEAEISAKQPDVAHESDLRWKENLFYRGEEELTRRRVFSNNLMQLVYGDGDSPEDKETDVAAEEETSDDDFFHPKQVAEAMCEAARKNRLVDGLDSEKLDIFPAVKHDWNDEAFLAEFKIHFVTGVWGDQLSSESESESEEEEDEGDDAIVDLENEEEGENEEEEGEEASRPQDEIISDEELLEDPHVPYNSIEEEREANAAKKAAAREAKEAAEEEAKEVASDEEKEGKKKEKKEKEEDYFDLLKRKRAEQEEKAKQEFEDVPQAEKDLLLGLPTGTYCRIKLEDVPPAFIRLARPEIPVIVGGLQESEEALGMVRVSVLYRWVRSRCVSRSIAGTATF